MLKNKFKDFWNVRVYEWYHNAAVKTSKTTTKVCDLCQLKTDYYEKVYNNYNTIKSIIKEKYFKSVKDKKISIYKRAAVICYAVLLSDPFETLEMGGMKEDPNFLKQRLAFYMGLTSIMQHYRDKPYNGYNFDKLDMNIKNGDDIFLVRVYKDLFYSEIYKNYNVFTWANLYSVLTIMNSDICE